MTSIADLREQSPPKEDEVSEFVSDLRKLRELAGMPSFRKMAAVAHYSHTALLGALSGNSLPSLPLTLGVVRACHGDETTWERRWHQANAAQRLPILPTCDEHNKAQPNWRMRVGTVVGLLVILSTAVVADRTVGPHRVKTPPAQNKEPAMVPASGAPLVAGDNDDFVTDVTIPDGTIVNTGQVFVKTWEIRNTGQVPWAGRYLTRVGAQGPGLCSSPSQVPIPETMPNHNVQISVSLTAPTLPGSCRVDWKMTDVAGTPFFPNKQGLYLIVNVIQ